jgi:hypothetical protein
MSSDGRATQRRCTVAGKRCGLFGLSDGESLALNSFTTDVDDRHAGTAGKTGTVSRRRKKTSPAKQIAGLVFPFFS